MSPGSKKYIGLVGAGYWGKNLVRIFHKLRVLKTVCDKDRKVLFNLRKEKSYSGIKTTTNFSEALKDKEIKGIVISTPASTHYALTKKALKADKDVFVEKPLALKVKEGEELVRIAQKKKMILMVDHLLLYHPAIIEIEKLIKKGELGDIFYIFSALAKLGIIRREENVLWSFAPHDIAIIVDILGMPKKVVSVGRAFLQKNIPDISFSLLEFEKGKRALIWLSWLYPQKERKLVVVGSRKMIIFENQPKEKLTLYSYKIKKFKDKRPEFQETKGEFVRFSKKEPLLEAAKYFLECIKKRKVPKTDGKEGLQVLRILDACQRSMDREGRPFELKI
jgi:UDP-2-acetamido-3-amino-2,3-dideoxy-glucuronate N-acetyltransferase